MQLSNVCRLCLNEDKLIWVFDKRFENGSMKDVVQITTGVEISTSDTISQKICAKCSELTIRMFEFRKTSQRSDSFLKERSKQYLKTNNIANLPTEVEIKKEKFEPEVKPKHAKIRVHKSIRELYKKYSGIRLPDICLNSDYAPVVSLTMHGVERYFKKRNLDFDFYAKAALQAPKRVATKKTSAANKPKPKSHKAHRTDDIRLLDAKIINRDNSTNKISIKFLKSNDTNASSAESSSTNKDHLKSKTSKALEPEREPVQKKRKYSEAERSDSEVKKPAFVESLGLTSKSGAPEDPAYVANVSTPLHICHICNAVHYNAKDLRKHQNKHLRCQFCKTRFRSLESKKAHISKSCPIKNAMNNLPDVVLERIEDSQKVRKKYPDAFSEFPVFNNNVINENENLVVKPEGETDDSENVKKTSIVVTAPPIDIIEINSDEEDSAPPPTGGKNSDASNSVGNNVPQDNSNENIPNLGSSPSIPPRLLPIPENIVYNTVSIVRPDVRIKNNYLLDSMDPKMSDVKLLKHLLVDYKRVEFTAEQSNQTEPPTNDSIQINPDGTAELKNLKPQLYAYKIPVSIKMGPLNLSYDSTPREQRSRKLHLWRNLTPVDVKVKNANVPKSVSETVVRESEKQGSDVNNTKTLIVLPSTATYNSSAALPSFVLNNASSSTANTQTFLPASNSYVTHFTDNPSVKTYPAAKSNIPATITSSTFNPINSNAALYQPTATVNIPVPFSLVRTTTAQPQSGALNNVLLGNNFVVPTSVKPHTSLTNASNNVLFGNSCAMPNSAQPHLPLNSVSSNLLLGNSCVVTTSAQPPLSVNNASNNVLIGSNCVLPTSIQPQALNATSNNILIGNSYVVPTSVQQHTSLNNTPNNVLLGNSCVVPTSIQSQTSLNRVSNNVLLGNSRAVPSSGQPHASLNNASNNVLLGNSLGSSCVIPTSNDMMNNLIDRNLPRSSHPTSQSITQSNSNLNLLNNNSLLPPNPNPYSPLTGFAASGPSSSSANQVLPGSSLVPQSSSSSTITVGAIRVKNVWELT